jgi:hypothetical protein
MFERVQADASTREIPTIVTATVRRHLERAEENTQRYGGQHFLAKPMDLGALVGMADDRIGKA